MGSDELAANLFRAGRRKQKLRNDPTITDEDRANDAHHKMGAALREFFVIEQGNPPPEQLPTPAESIAQLQRREPKRLAALSTPGASRSSSMTLAMRMLLGSAS